MAILNATSFHYLVHPISNIKKLLQKNSNEIQHLIRKENKNASILRRANFKSYIIPLFSTPYFKYLKKNIAQIAMKSSIEYEKKRTTQK